MSISCPVCGSEKLNKNIRKISLPVKYGRDVQIDETVYTCQECQVEGDFASENDEIIERALNLAKSKSAGAMLDDLSTQGISMAYFERALNLPTRSLARWKKGEITAAGLALLKVVRTIPWVLEIADEDFDEIYVNKRIVQESNAIIGAAFAPFLVSGKALIESDGQVATVKVECTFSADGKETICYAQPVGTY